MTKNLKLSQFTKSQQENLKTQKQKISVRHITMEPQLSLLLQQLVKQYRNTNTTKNRFLHTVLKKQQQKNGCETNILVI